MKRFVKRTIGVFILGDILALMVFIGIACLLSWLLG
jgi:hypothetical protein